MEINEDIREMMREYAIAYYRFRSHKGELYLGEDNSDRRDSLAKVRRLGIEQAIVDEYFSVVPPPQG